jgi:hypothetical protein
MDVYLEEPGVQLCLQTLLVKSTTTSTVLFKLATGDCTEIHATILVQFSEQSMATQHNENAPTFDFFCF